MHTNSLLNTDNNDQDDNIQTHLLITFIPIKHASPRIFGYRDKIYNEFY